VARLVNVADGSTVVQYEYEPFGEVLRATGLIAKTNPFRFSTKYQDDESDLCYYGFRYYSASTGRWLSRDPFEETGGYNLYSIDNNDDISKIDMLGCIQQPTPPSWTESTARTAVQAQINWELSKGYNFAAHLLQNLLNKGGDYYGSQDEIDEIKNSSKYRSEMYSLLKQKATQWCDDHAKLHSHGTLLEAAGHFDLYYYTGDLFYALGGAHFTYNGIMSVECPCSINFFGEVRWGWHGNVTQDDPYVFLVSSPGQFFDSYSAAYYLQNAGLGYQVFHDLETWEDDFESDYSK
jgi:RHS repeat-associated protein